MLFLEKLSKRYGAVTVIDSVSLEFRPGEIHALIGANGAGKSTLCKIVSGLISPDGGSMTMEDHRFTPRGKQEAERAGVQIVQQELNLISTLTVAENISLARMPTRFGLINRRKLHQTSRQSLDRLGLADIDSHAVVGDLGVGRQQMVEIATALTQECKLLILDEPTAALSVAESERLFVQLNQLRLAGVAIIYISHRLEEVARMADRVSVLRDGQLVCTKEAAQIAIDDIVGLMSGEDAGRRHEHRSYVADETVFQCEKLSDGNTVDNVTFHVRHGERLGIAGLVGSGRTELLRLIFGADKATGGTITMPRFQGRFDHPWQAVKAGLAMVTEDRKKNGVLLNQSIRVNTTLNTLWSLFSWFSLIRHGEEVSATNRMVDRLATRCNDSEQLLETLSGGNQQKVAVSKWLVRDADVYLFDEPTRGIDIAARQRIYQLFEDLAQHGKAMVIVSSDLDELFETCDRILVMSGGRLVAEFSRRGFSHEQIMQAAFSAYVSGESLGGEVA